MARFLFIVLLICRAATAQWIWWEAEAPAGTNFPARGPFAPRNLDHSHLLSAGDWLSIAGPRGDDEAWARYSISVPVDGEYRLWVRKFWRHGAFRWRFDGGTWQTVTRDAGLSDDVTLAKHVSANWVCAGGVALTAGRHLFELRLLAHKGQDATAAFDCFLLTHDFFIPRGKLKPGRTSGAAEDGYFPYEPAIDRFEDSPIDLRHLNETIAGEKGFLRRQADALALADGTPASFWAVNIGVNNIMQDHASIDYMARKLAKLGVNMVRFHGQLFENHGDVARLNPAMLDGLHYTVASLKRQGIYTKLSFYFPVWAKITNAYGIDGYQHLDDPQPFALLYFNPRMQEIHRAWAKQLLTTVNPYTQLALARDPAIGIIELVNEDSLFFWTFTKGTSE